MRDGEHKACTNGALLSARATKRSKSKAARVARLTIKKQESIRKKQRRGGALHAVAGREGESGVAFGARRRVGAFSTIGFASRAVTSGEEEMRLAVGACNGARALRAIGFARRAGSTTGELVAVLALCAHLVEMSTVLRSGLA
jgi:hypothetical protein